MSSRGKTKTKIGTVVSDKMDKSILVRVDRKVQHKLYKKYVTRSSKFVAHDETNECKNGDKVKIIETRPLSRRKRWRLMEILEKAEQV
ncbi:MAG: 30S ribosomal protein S17 [Candidatus Marinimicrobia bacterium]|nr:30S ribosomal protein S17 [Candidatus Neomarinimicrobiota bacterium]MCF7827481.1 30S ribosomal protein S17 [Candidatus Neomarinimicrobiota bacterium]MCF7882389.1 30S ribosomal protein S17 [Candidatus Neomarinimicrobiota bacterium]